MKGFHSTVSRRDFMKAIGLGAAGLSAAATIPVFSDIDELTASTQLQKLPWWVKEKDYKDVTATIDWSMLKREEGMVNPRATIPAEAFSEGDPPGHHKATLEERKILFDYMKEEFPGWEPGGWGMGDVRTTALANCTDFLRFGVWPSMMQMGGKMVSVIGAVMAAGGTASFDSFLGPQIPSIPTPEEMGVPKWQGTPEENLQTMRSAVRFLGGSEVGAIEVDDDIKKFIWKNSGGKSYVWRDVDQAQETATEYVIPNKCKWIFVWTSRQPFESTRRQAGEYEDAAVMYCYANVVKIKAHIQEFTRAIGYQMLGGAHCAIGQAGGLATLAGMGEHGRMSSPTITPKYGTTNRAMWSMLTDLPLAPTKPIDFGAYKFCHSCGICADACPFGLIQQGDPTYESPYAYCRSGYKGWHTDTSGCPHCPTCQGACPFNTQPGSFVHDIVKGTIANTSIFNSFFTQMEKTMGYGRKDPRDWWDIEDYTWGINTSY